MIIKENRRDDGKQYAGKEIYKMTKSDSIQKLSTIDGMFSVLGFILYEDEKADGTTVPILSIESSTNEVFATNSATFIRSFMDIMTMMDYELPIDIVVGHKTSNKGREFIYCDLV